jgi:hypothetical protein
LGLGIDALILYQHPQTHTGEEPNSRPLTLLVHPHF